MPVKSTSMLPFISVADTTGCVEKTTPLATWLPGLYALESAGNTVNFSLSAITLSEHPVPKTSTPVDPILSKLVPDSLISLSFILNLNAILSRVVSVRLLSFILRNISGVEVLFWLINSPPLKPMFFLPKVISGPVTNVTV